MGIPVWTAHRTIDGQKQVSTDEPGKITELVPQSLDAQWQLLHEEVAACLGCDLHRTRKNVVFGSGNKHADLMIIGEAPGLEEELKAEPFVGSAGQLLNQMLFSLGFSRDDVFITNILKCTSPDNRKPSPAEIKACSDFLIRQINLLKPKVILCLGAVSAKALLGSGDTISHLRGQVKTHHQTSTPVVATFHPAYLLRKPTEKRVVWADLLLTKKVMLEAL